MTLNKEQLHWVGDQALALTLVGKDCLSSENLLMISKWPGYRFMTPLAATKLFAAEYAKAYKACLRKNVDTIAAQNSRVGMTTDLSIPNGRMTQMWMARQRADQVGLPYPEYLGFCFDFATRRQRHQLPQPNQLTGKDGKYRAEFERVLATFWDFDRKKTALDRMPFMDVYQIAEGRALPARTALLDQLNEAQLSVPNIETFVGRYLVELGYLDDVDLHKALSPDRATTIINIAAKSGDWVRESVPADSVGLYQACHGLPGVTAGVVELCESCPARQSCSELRILAEGEVFRATGSDDPKTEHARAMNRQHVRNSRARTKAAAIENSRSAIVISEPDYNL